MCCGTLSGNTSLILYRHTVARAATIVSSRIIGDGNQYQMLQQKEAYARAMALSTNVTKAITPSLVNRRVRIITTATNRSIAVTIML